MRLTAIWYGFRDVKPHGHVWRGKNRKVKDPTFNDLRKLREDFERQEENMLILRHPYLTVQQERLTYKELHPRPNWPELSRAERNEKFQRHFTWTDQLCHLRVTDNWE